MKLSILFFTLLFMASGRLWSLTTVAMVSAKDGDGRFALVVGDAAAPLLLSRSDYPGVYRVAAMLQADIERVTDRKPAVFFDDLPAVNHVVVIGALSTPLIKRLVNEKKIKVDDLVGKWEKYLLQVVENPFPNIKQALIITGSDKRAVLYAMFELSAQIGVSPWTWWADVPVMKQSAIHILPGRYVFGEPAVKYRGIFINDEEPALGRWAVERYGGFTSPFYERVFELMLRLKANYLWPAMWWASFNSDDPRSPELADDLGIVMGTTHHEPMMRAHAEWRAIGGAWNYETNPEQLRKFWTEGIERMARRESIVTLAMRGDGDMPMTESANIALLQKIVADQRRILAIVTGQNPAAIPQIWALYKEVQEYYDKGMTVPDDVTLLLCDDNWGNLRRLPRIDDPPRPGGYGIYYHFDYVGGPRNYKWLNTNQISRVWEQMHLAFRHGVNRIWIVNVGDIKPMEFPIEFFLDYAWDPEQWPAERMAEYPSLWAERQFGAPHAEQIGRLLTLYTQFASRRKPELLSPDTYSLIHHREAERIVEDYLELDQEAEQVMSSLPPFYHDAYFQLILYPIKACTVLNDLYLAVAKNHLYAEQGRAATNDMAERAEELFRRDAELARYYNHELAGGKWNHMMDQTHIGYSGWQQPEVNVMPEVKRIDLQRSAAMAVAIEGSAGFWPDEGCEAVLPEYDPFHQQKYFIDIFNRGSGSFEFSAAADKPWVIISPPAGLVDKEQRVWVSVDWDLVTARSDSAVISFRRSQKEHLTVKVRINNPSPAERQQISGFVESNGFIAIEAEHYSRKFDAPPVYCQSIPHLGRTLSAMTIMPVTASAQIAGMDGPRLEYDLYLFNSGEVIVKCLLSPTLNFHATQGLRFAVSMDNESPQIINMHADFPQDWEKAVSDNIIEQVSKHTLEQPGIHVLKFWFIDPGVVLQKLTVETRAIGQTYLGPPESEHVPPLKIR